jgi:type IV secretion system protein VirD4
MSSRAPVLQRQVRLPAMGAGRSFLLLMGVAGVFGAWCATQLVAHRLGFDPRLGAPLYIAPPTAVLPLSVAASLAAGLAVAAVGWRRARSAAPLLALLAVVMLGLAAWPVYAPYRVVEWAVAHHGEPLLADIWYEARIAFGCGALALMTSLLPLLRLSRTLVASISHGSARWSDGSQLLGPGGMRLGRRLGDDRLLSYRGEGHHICLSPTGGGKGVSSVIPNLLHHRGSTFVIDVKPELHAVTARRRRELGQRVVCIDPFAEVGGQDACNPMDWIDVEGPDALDDADMIADMCVAIGERSKTDEHWNEEGLALLTGLILHVKTTAPPELQHLPYVRRQLMLPGGIGKKKGPFDVLLRDMLRNHAIHNLIHQRAAAILQKASPERSGVISAVQAHTHFLSSPRMSVLKRSTFDFADLKRGNLTVFLVLPAKRLRRYNRFLRLMTGLALTRISAVRGKTDRKIRFFLDEFTQLKRLAPVEEALRLHRSKGVQLSLYIQDLASFEDVYPVVWKSFLANCDVFQAFGANDVDTAEYLSRRAGETTILVQSENRSRGRSRGKHDQTSEGAAETTSEKNRRLITADEILRMGTDDRLQLLFLKGQDPLLARRLSYLSDPLFRDQFDANPEYAEVAG